MKKIIALLLFFWLCASLCACGGDGANSENPKKPTESESATWVGGMTVDEFGDVTENSTRIMTALISGSFSNTATTDSELGGCVFVIPDLTGLHFMVAFRLLEYGDIPVSYISSEAKDIELKIKIGDRIQEYSLYGEAPTGDLYLGFGLDDETDGDYFVDSLYLGNDIRCIITIGSSQYQFDVSCDDFAKAFQKTYELHSSKDALNIFLSGEYRRAGTMYFMYSSSDLVPTRGVELAEILPGYWRSTDIETNSRDSFYRYTEDGKIERIGQFVSNELVAKGDKEWQYTLDNASMHRNDGSIYQYMKIIDGYYLATYQSTWGVKYFYLYTECQENGAPVYPLA